MKDIQLYKWSGAGNLFVVADCRYAGAGRLGAGHSGADASDCLGADASDCSGEDAATLLRKPETIKTLCHQHGTDGLMLLLPPATPGCEFAMEFYNPDGSGGMMCGNGGRCIVAFAHYLGLGSCSAENTTTAASALATTQKAQLPGNNAISAEAPLASAPKDGNTIELRFNAPDGIHSAQILNIKEDNNYTVRLQMVNVSGIQPLLGGYFLNTGTRHFVKLVEDTSKIDVATDGKALRSNPAFAPEGTNVNFLSSDGFHLSVRTFEKGVEAETLACGTGITACAIVAYHAGIKPHASSPSGSVEYTLRARTSELTVNFLPAGKEEFKDIFLTGPAKLLAII